MKKLFLSLVAIMISTVIFAQSKLVATLTHGDQVTMFYGNSAFNAAHDAAESGDVIMLSGGEFTSFTLTKAITVRGTGIDAAIPTRIMNYGMVISIPETDENKLSIEGVTFGDLLQIGGSFSSPVFLKCKFNSVVLYDDYNNRNNMSIQNAQFVNCIVSGSFNPYGSSTVQMAHCYIENFSNEPDNSTKILFQNSIIKGNFPSFYKSSFINSILVTYNNGSDANLPAETVAMNCSALLYYYYGGSLHYLNANPYSNMQGSEIDCGTTTFENLFVSYKGEFSNSETFELTDDAKTTFLGTDGTQIGLYGGQYPYSPVPSYPRFTKFNVAKQATADDKLSVEIEVSGAE